MNQLQAQLPIRPSVHLSPREREVLRLLRIGRSEKEAGAALRISIHTVHAYVKRIYRRYGVNSRGELLSRWSSPLPDEVGGNELDAGPRCDPQIARAALGPAPRWDACPCRARWVPR